MTTIIEYVEFVLGVLTTLFCGLIYKLWTSSDTYFSEKAKNYATKEDIAEITRKSEMVQDEFKRTFELFDMDLQFQYKMYEKQYNELYSKLYYWLCKSESIKFCLNKSDVQINIEDAFIMDYSNDYCQQILNNICDLIQKKHALASPSLIKICCLIKELEKCNFAIEDSDEIMCELKKSLYKTIVTDYVLLRKKLNLPETKTLPFDSKILY